MKLNMGYADRWIRGIVGVVGLGLFFFGPKSPWGLFGIIPLATALVGYCPLYTPFHWNTRGGK